jgi:hypothetical protein
VVEYSELMLSVLENEVQERAPRLFAVYGVYRKKVDEDDDRLFLGYGVEYEEPRKAVMWEDGMTTRSDSAEAILRRRSRLADARLVWLYEPERPAQEDYDLAGG